MSSISKSDFARLTVVQLRDHLKTRGLPTGGTKAELVERLTESCLAEDKILDSDVSATKDAIEEAVLDASIEDDLLGLDSAPKKKQELAPQVSMVEPKKVDAVEANIRKEEQSEKKEEGKKEDETIDAKTKRAIRFGLPLSSEQLKRKRAQRFGSAEKDALSSEERKRKRAERFGLTVEGTQNSENPEKAKDILKKRAERFGLEIKSDSSHAGSRSREIGNVEKASLEKLEMRAKRFGISSEQAELEIKKQKRAERFGLDK